jgi:hypothetical protein
MNPRLSSRCLRRLLVIFACGVAGMLSTSRAAGQPLGGLGTKPTTGPTTAPKGPGTDVKSGDTPVNVEALNKFVKECVARIASTDDSEAAVTVAIGAKGELIQASASPGPPQKLAVPSYLTPYISTLARELAGPVNSPSVRVRVNVGVVTARVVDNCKLANFPATALQPIIMKLLTDPNPGVALWGMKAAASLLTTGSPPINNPQLLEQIVKTLSDPKIKFNGPITDEAYSALKDAQSKEGIDKLVQVFKARVAMYANGDTPPDPIIDRRPASALTVQAGMWKVMTKADQADVMNTIANLLDGAAAAMQKPGISAETLEELKQLITTTLSAASVVAGSSPALQSLAVIVSGSLKTNVTPGNVASVIGPVTQGIRTAFPISGNTQTAKQP